LLKKPDQTAFLHRLGHLPTFATPLRRWLEFKRRYGAELDTRQDVVTEILSLAIDRPVTLLYSARDPDHNQAVALAEYLTALRSKRA